MIKKSRIEQRLRVKARVAKKVRGTTERPRMVIYRSLHHVYAQIVDDTKAVTVLAASTLSKEVQEELKGVKGQKEIAKVVGAHVAKKALAKNIKRVVFDRNGYLYHGVVKSLADGARAAGLEF